MVTQIHIKNINAIEDTVISFEKSRYHYLCENIYNDKLVNPIAFYGTNGSGKTSFVDAISQFVQILWKEPGNYSMFVPNLFSEDKISEFKICFKLDSLEYIYEIKTHYNDGIIEENLITDNDYYFKKNNSLSYVYNKKDYSLNSSTYSVLRKLANDLADDKIIKVYNFLSNISYIDATKQEYLCKKLEQKSINDLMVEQSNVVENILVNYKHFPVYSYNSKNIIEGRKDYYITMNIKGQNYSLHSAFMSSGMYNQSAMLSILTALPDNSLLIIDEIEDALHPVTIMDFINVVQKKGIQLIFTSHNTYILQKLRPDQIIFANWNNGVSHYKKLSDIYPNIREVNNIEKMYLSHMFDDDIESNE